MLADLVTSPMNKDRALLKQQSMPVQPTHSRGRKSTLRNFGGPPPRRRPSPGGDGKLTPLEVNNSFPDSPELRGQTRFVPTSSHA